MRFNKIYIFVLIALIAMVSGCRKSDRDHDTRIIASLDNARAESTFNSIFKEVHGVLIEDYHTYAGTDASRVNALSSCIDSLSVITTSGTYPKTITLDYGTAYTACTDGMVRQGKVYVWINGLYSDSLTSIKVTFEDFMVDSFAVSGSIVMKNKGLVNGSPQYLFDVNNGLIQGDSTRVEYKSSQVLKWVRGYGTVVITDDAYEVNGTATGRMTNGNSYDAQIQTAEEFEVGCYYITTGIVLVTPHNLNQRIVNYGTGTCDNSIDVALGGRLYAANTDTYTVVDLTATE